MTTKAERVLKLAFNVLNVTAIGEDKALTIGEVTDIIQSDNPDISYNDTATQLTRLFSGKLARRKKVRTPNTGRMVWSYWIDPRKVAVEETTKDDPGTCMPVPNELTVPYSEEMPSHMKEAAKGINSLPLHAANLRAGWLSGDLPAVKRAIEEIRMATYKIESCVKHQLFQNLR